MSRRGLALAAALVVVAVAGAIAGGIGPFGAGRGPGDLVEGSYESIDGLDDFFSPQVLRVAPRSAIEFENKGRNPHNVTADDGSFSSGLMLPGDEFDVELDEPGVYPFTCTLHGSPGAGMTGIIVVGDVALPPRPDAAFGVGPGPETPPLAPGRTIRVPADQPTIQRAVDAADPGDLVLVARGVYAEGVLVRTPFLTIRGEDRNETILDGEYRRANGVAVIEADGVAIENLTARHFELNGFYWAGVNGYRGSYLTAYANGDYGIYAFDSAWGRFEHSYVSGNPDSGFYIGQCKPCHAVITDVVAAENALGYSGTNAGGDLALVNSEWRDNMAGIVPNTLDSEALAPQDDVLIAGNHVHDNDRLDVPAQSYPYAAFGIGILVSGGRNDEIRGNLVEDHPTYGIAVLPIIDSNLWTSGGNEVRGNVVRRSGEADLALGAPSGGRDCFADNDHATSLPAGLESIGGCGSPFGRLGGGGLGVTIGSLLTRYIDTFDGDYPHGAWEDWPAPPNQPDMPDAATAPAAPAIPEIAVPGGYTIRDVGSITPDAPSSDTSREVTILAIPLDNTPWGILLGLYGYVFPLVLWTAWVAISLWDLVRRDDLSSRRRLLWMALILAVPAVGPVVYLWLGGSLIDRAARLMLVVGGAVVYLALLGLAVVLGAG